MKVLMISIDKGLLGRGQLGDVIERHKKYGEFVERLDVVVFSKTGFEENIISETVTAYPTNSAGKLAYYFDAKKIAKKLFEQNHYDLIITQEPFLTGLLGVSLKKLYKSKLLVHLHGDYKGLLLRLAKILVLSKSDAIRVMSKGQKEGLLAIGIKEEKINVISTPVNLKRFSHQYWDEVKKYREETGVKYYIDEDIPIVLHVGRDDEVKDYKTLFSSFVSVYEKMPNVCFYQIGADLSREKIFKRYGLNMPDDMKIVFEPTKISDFLINAYLDSTVVVLSSKSESFGKVLIEANACGKPVVSTATTGAKEIIEDGINGFLVPIGDYTTLAEKVIYLLQNQEMAKKMGEQGKKMALEKFSDNTEKIINLWQKLINEK